MTAFSSHEEFTSPGKYAQAIDALSDNPGALLDVVRGLLIHGDYLALYTVDDARMQDCSRATLPLEQRLDHVLLNSPQPLSVARTAELRSVCTCRDYAVMTCGMLRQKFVPARVRCGFAGYLSPGRFGDHWICEYWRPDDKRWARADAQLDAQHRDHLHITFSTSDVPDGEFVTANTAWRMVRGGEVSANLFGHGDAAGEWFLWVNLARDYLSLQGRVTSDWDNWRAVLDREPELSACGRQACDELADDIKLSEQKRLGTVAAARLRPFWSDVAI